MPRMIHTLRARRAIVCISLLILSGCGQPLARDVARLHGRLDEVLDRNAATGAVIHARVVDLTTGHELYSRHADDACTPASNFKLLTTATALDLFGPAHLFKTWLATDGDDLCVIGSGDPGTGDPRLAKARGRTPLAMFDAWADALHKRGITRIKGDLVFDDSALEASPRVHPTWPKSWLLFWYGAPCAGLNFNDNSIDVTVLPTEAGKPVRYEVMPPVSCVEIENTCTTGKGSASISKLANGNRYRLRGSCEKRSELASKPVDDPGAFFADALRTHLAKRGIVIAGKIRRAETPSSGAVPPSQDKIVAVYETPIRDVLSRVNKNSQNLFAECLCKMTGREFERRRGRDVPGSWVSGGEALRAFLRKNRISDAVLSPQDGSGLSPENRTSARMLTEVLAVMYRGPHREAYRASLATAGVDGSIHDRMTQLKGRVFGKTGYIGGVSSLSGYVHTSENHWLAFSFVYNHVPESKDDDRDTEPFTKLQDEACGVLASWPTVPPASKPAP